MSERIEITDLPDVRDGDTVTVTVKGREYTGPAWINEGGYLCWADIAIRWDSGEPTGFGEGFVSATRKNPSLPTKAGSVILVHEADGKVCDPPVLAAHDGTDFAPWNVVRQIGSLDYLGDEDITRWQECDVTPRGEVIGQ